MSYKHLSTEQRYEINALKRAGFSNSEIAASIGIDRTTVWREFKRNGVNGRYGAGTADRRAKDRREAASSQPRRLTPELRQLIEQKLRDEQWSPEQIRDRLAHEGHATVSHETIYLHIWSDKRSGGDLHKHLRQANKKRRKRYGSNDRRGLLPNRVSIDERPAVVETRSRIGDWEIDTVIGAEHQGALVTSVERRSRYLEMRPVSSTKADEVTTALQRMLGGHGTKVLTITSDNGREFAQHEKFAKSLKCDVYFAHPYHSWERGTNENTNGLIRQYFPKNSNLRTADQQTVKNVQQKLNNRPRKTLNWKTPAEVFFGRSDLLFPKPKNMMMRC